MNEANASQANDEYISDPAIHPYIKYKQKVPLSVPVGFNSPESVAADLTNQLTKTDDPIFIDPLGTENRQSVIVNSTTNRAFPATNYVLFNGSFNQTYEPTDTQLSFVTGSDFYPYVSTIGLYDDKNNLLVVGKLAHPIKLSDELDTTFVIRFDV